MKQKLFAKRARSSGIKNVSPRWVRIMRIMGLGIGVTAILHLGVQTIWYLRTGNYYGHSNYWKQPVGTLLLAAIGVVGITVGLIVVVNKVKAFIEKKQ